MELPELENGFAAIDLAADKVVDTGMDAGMDIDNHVNDPDKLAIRVFQNGFDPYSSEDPNERQILRGQPNIYGSKYFDDEDFVYCRIGLADGILDNLNLDIVWLSNEFNVVLDYSVDSGDLTNNEELYIKVVNIWHYVNAYYTSLSSIRPRERIKQMPADLLSWVDNTVNILNYLLDIGWFIMPDNYPTDLKIDPTMYDEIINGLKLSITHIKMLINHYRIRGDILDDTHIPKLFRLMNNMCIIVIYLYNIESIEMG